MPAVRRCDLALLAKVWRLLYPLLDERRRRGSFSGGFFLPTVEPGRLISWSIAV
jgi:hypothetical protein